MSKPETMLLSIMIMYHGWFRTGTKLQSLLDVWVWVHMYIYIYIYIYVYVHIMGTCMCWVRVMGVWCLVAWACLSSGGRGGQQGSCTSMARLLHAVQWTQNLYYMKIAFYMLNTYQYHQLIWFICLLKFSKQMMGFQDSRWRLSWKLVAILKWSEDSYSISVISCTFYMPK